MATNYFPLVANATANTINELPSGDNLNLAGSNIVNATNITANSTVTSNTLSVTANANVTNTLTANIALITNANVNTFIGTANTAIYAAISVAANSGGDIAVALAIALG